MALRTPDLLVPLSVQAMYLCVFLSQVLQAAVERICDLKVVVGAASAVFRVVEGRFHLMNRGHDLFGLVDQLLLFGINQMHLAVECLGQSLKELGIQVSTMSLWF